MSRNSKKKQRWKKELPPAEQMLLEFLPPEWKATHVLCVQSDLQPLTTGLIQRDMKDSRIDCFKFLIKPLPIGFKGNARCCRKAVHFNRMEYTL